MLPPCLATNLCFPDHPRLALAMEPAVSCMAFEPLTFLNEGQGDPTLKPSPVSAIAHLTLFLNDLSFQNDLAQRVPICSSACSFSKFWLGTGGTIVGRPRGRSPCPYGMDVQFRD